MTKSSLHKRMFILGKCALVLLSGLRYMILGTLTLGLFAVAIAGFCLVPIDDGYQAVLDFIAACFTLLVSVASMYLLGLPRKRRGGRYEAK